VIDAEQHHSDVLWACVEDGFHVGSRGGDFLGFVDRQSDGRYRAFDAHSQEIGDFVELADATAAVRDVSDDLIADNVDGVAR